MNGRTHPSSRPLTDKSADTRSSGITGVILAGGRGRRMGGVDKGLQLFRGRQMVEWVLERLAPQVSEILINANQNLQRYASLGHRVVPDDIAGFAGPLAGLHRGMLEAGRPLVITVPCDSPFLPADLVSRLLQGLQHERADLAVARTGDRSHPVFCLAHARLLPHLERFLSAGGRKIDAWYADLRVVEVPFDDEAKAFGNFNTLEELREAESGG